MSASSQQLSLKLLIDRTGNRVVFAEAGKEAIDFLFSLVTLPIGSFVKLLPKQGTMGDMGCFANLNESIDKMNVKNVPSQPNAAAPTEGTPLLSLFPNTSNEVPKKGKSYLCSRKISSGAPFHCFVAENPQISCPICGYLMNREVELVVEDHKMEETAAVVKRVDCDTYMVMDDLVVKPMCSRTISGTIALLKELKVKDIEALEEKVVDLTYDKVCGLAIFKSQNAASMVVLMLAIFGHTKKTLNTECEQDLGLKLLKMAFVSKKVLTSVFLNQEDPTVEEAKQATFDSTVTFGPSLFL